MSPQLRLSSLFSALALALLCVTTSLGQLAGDKGAIGGSQSLISKQAGLSPGLLQD